MTEMIKMTKYKWLFLDMEIDEKFIDIAGYHFCHFVNLRLLH
jgi:hypothetical protein